MSTECEKLIGVFGVLKYGLIALFAGIACAQSQAPAPCLQKPVAERAYSKDRLLEVIKGQTPARAEFLIRACGVALVWSDSLAPELKAANASDKVIQTVRDMTKPKAPPPPPPPVGPKPGEIRTNSKEGVTYAFVPPGTFEMGCDTCDADEKPVHKVRITRGFWMAQREVKVGAFKNYAKAAGIKMPAEPALPPRAFNPKWANDQQPMSMASFTDAHNYCQWAGMRLPTEAEWEYAARGPAGVPAAELNTVAWSADNSGKTEVDSQGIWKKDPKNYLLPLLENGIGPHDVGRKAANGWKLFDMLGNVWEWTSDWYRENAYAASASDDPTGPDSGSRHVLRGGSWINFPSYLRVTKRLKGHPDDRIYVNGFRCAGTAIK